MLERSQTLTIFSKSQIPFTEVRYEILTRGIRVSLTRSVVIDMDVERERNSSVKLSSKRRRSKSARVGESGHSQAPCKRHFVGLENEGRTCYLNSILQTLFMTPELRQVHEYDVLNV